MSDRVETTPGQGRGPAERSRGSPRRITGAAAGTGSGTGQARDLVPLVLTGDLSARDGTARLADPALVRLVTEGVTDGRTRERDSDVVARAAVAAPSLRDTQPWLLRIVGGRVDILRDPDRTLPHTDPRGREATISCGAAAFGAGLAVSMLGQEPRMALLPDPGSPTHLATIVPGESRSPATDEERLFGALPLRRSNRRPYSSQNVPEHVVTELETAVRAEGAWIREVRTAGQRRVLAELARRAAGAHLRTRERREELAARSRPGPGPASGVDRGAVDGRLDPADGVFSRFVLPGDRNRSGLLAPPDTTAADLDRDLILVVGTRGDEPRDWLRAGLALHRMLLSATIRGLAGSVLTQLGEFPDLRRALTDGLRLPLSPQFVVRLGYPTCDVAEAPRRALDAVVREDLTPQSDSEVTTSTHFAR